jgi:hypothetical protein
MNKVITSLAQVTVEWLTTCDDLNCMHRALGEVTHGQ